MCNPLHRLLAVQSLNQVPRNPDGHYSVIDIRDCTALGQIVRYISVTYQKVLFAVLSDARLHNDAWATCWWPHPFSPSRMWINYSLPTMFNKPKFNNRHKYWDFIPTGCIGASLACVFITYPPLFVYLSHSRTILSLFTVKYALSSCNSSSTIRTDIWTIN